MRVAVRTEFTVSATHRPGSLRNVLEAMALGGANVLAMCGYGQGETANLMLVSDREDKARAALRAAGFNPVETRVLCVTTSSGKGAGAKITAQLAKAGINIEYAYATTSGTGQGMAVFGVQDPERALIALKKK